MIFFVKTSYTYIEKGLNKKCFLLHVLQKCSLNVFDKINGLG